MFIVFQTGNCIDVVPISEAYDYTLFHTDHGYNEDAVKQLRIFNTSNAAWEYARNIANQYGIVDVHDTGFITLAYDDTTCVVMRRKRGSSAYWVQRGCVYKYTLMGYTLDMEFSSTHQALTYIHHVTGDIPF